MHDNGVSSVSDTGILGKKFPSSPNRSQTFDLRVTGPDALPLRCRRLVEARLHSELTRAACTTRYIGHDLSSLNGSQVQTVAVVRCSRCF